MTTVSRQGRHRWQLQAVVSSSAAVAFAPLTGLSDDQGSAVWAYLGNVSISGLLLAGFIIGSLGVLNDVTVTQASTVFELAHLASSASRRAVFVAAIRVGRDHIASTVYTLVLAYAGSSLPLLLLFSVANRSLSDILVSGSVAIEITRSSVGGIALALSVPLTTAIAVLLSNRTTCRRVTKSRSAPFSTTSSTHATALTRIGGPTNQDIQVPPKDASQSGHRLDPPYSVSWKFR